MIWGLVVGICAIGVIALAVMTIGEDKDAGRRYRERVTRLITMRADAQHAAALRAEPYGVYGEFMPPEGLR